MHAFYFSLFDQVIDTSSARGGVLECIELSTMVDFSMGTINLMLRCMTSDAPLHVLWADNQLKPIKVGSSCLWAWREELKENKRTQVRARGDILPKASGRGEQGRRGTRRVGARIQGVQPPSCVTESERLRTARTHTTSCACQACWRNQDRFDTQDPCKSKPKYICLYLPIHVCPPWHLRQAAHGDLEE